MWFWIKFCLFGILIIIQLRCLEKTKPLKSWTIYQGFNFGTCFLAHKFHMKSKIISENFILISWLILRQPQIMAHAQDVGQLFPVWVLYLMLVPSDSLDNSECWDEINILSSLQINNSEEYLLHVYRHKMWCTYIWWWRVASISDTSCYFSKFCQKRCHMTAYGCTNLRIYFWIHYHFQI